MATQLEAREKIIDLILEFIILNDISLDSQVQAGWISDYRKYVDPSTGQIATGTLPTDDTDIVVYQKDYNASAFSQDLITKVDAIVRDCLVHDGSGNYDLESSALVPGYCDDASGDLQEDCTGNWVVDDSSATTYDVFTSGLSTGWVFVDYDQSCTTDCGAYPCISFSNSGAQLSGCSVLGGTMTCHSGSPGVLQLTDEVLDALSQFITFSKTQTNISGQLADNILDTNIYELIPSSKNRQQRINKMFSEFQALIGTSPSADITGAYNDDVTNDGTSDTWIDITTSQNYWNSLYGINPDVDETVGDIVRLTRHESISGQSLESMRLKIDDYLKDLDYTVQSSNVDDRPALDSATKPYLQIRHLNQSIIVRNEEDKDIGIMGSGVAPNWESKGFTIAMWVRFLTKSSGGTLFNFGNPSRTKEPYGFRLETFTVSEDDFTDESLPITAFTENNYHRFVRLVVNDGDGLDDSHFGTPEYKRVDTMYMQDGDQTPETGAALERNIGMAFNHTEIPIDFNEWFYIVATYNPAIDSMITIHDSCKYTRLYYENHIEQPYPQPGPNFECDPHLNPAVSVVSNSGYGNKCKVEIISKSDLMRARGYNLDI